MLTKVPKPTNNSMEHSVEPLCMPVTGNSDYDTGEGSESDAVPVAGRRADANCAAIRYLAEVADGGRVEATAARDVLIRWQCERSTRRKRVRPANAEFVASDALGIAATPNVRTFGSGFCMTSCALNYVSFVKLLNQFLKERLSDMQYDTSASESDREYAKNFRWTTIVINQDLKCERHRDTNNVGLSAILAVGPHKGGDLRYWPHDDGKLPVSALSLDDCQLLKVSKGIRFFDGRKAHETKEFRGKRTSIIWYSVKNTDSMDDDLRGRATSMGFVVPERSS